MCFIESAASGSDFSTSIEEGAVNRRSTKKTRCDNELPGTTRSNGTKWSVGHHQLFGRDPAAPEENRADAPRREPDHQVAVRRRNGDRVCLRSPEKAALLRGRRGRVPAAGAAAGALFDRSLFRRDSLRGHASRGVRLPAGAPAASALGVDVFRAFARVAPTSGRRTESERASRSAVNIAEEVDC